MTSLIESGFLRALGVYRVAPATVFQCMPFAFIEWSFAQDFLVGCASFTANFSVPRRGGSPSFQARIEYALLIFLPFFLRKSALRSIRVGHQHFRCA